MTVAANHRKPSFRILAGLFPVLTGRVRRARPDFEPAPPLHRNLPAAEGVHDLRNVLTILSACAERLAERAPRGVADDELADLRAYVSRALVLSTELLVAADRPIVRTSVDLNDVVTPVIATLSRCLGPRLRLRLRLAAGPLGVVADPSEIEKILLNLSINAIEAMGHQGLLTITTGRVVKLSPLPARDANVGVARLEVSDTGCGVSDDVVAADIFEPSSTTKDGAGLGLTSAAATVRSLGGTIRVDSTPGRGTTVTVDLPYVNGDTTTPQSS